jgi:CBS domain-containing protein
MKSEASLTETKTAFDRVRVAEAMHAGVIAVPSDVPLVDVARIMSEQRIHCVVVTGAPEDPAPAGNLWGVVSDLDLAAAAEGELAGRTAGGSAATPLVFVAPDDTLTRAAQLMTEHSVAHLVVVDPLAGKPVGVVSTLDLARVAAAPPA